MAKGKYLIEYRSKDKATGKYDKGTMTSRIEVLAENEFDAVSRMKTTIAFKTSADKKDWEVIKVTLK